MQEPAASGRTVWTMLVASAVSVGALVAQPPETENRQSVPQETETASRGVRSFVTDESISFSYNDGRREVTLVATDHVLVRSKSGRYELVQLPEGVVRSRSSVSRSSDEMSEIPVFQSDGGNIQAPVGGVLIHFQDGWSEDQAGRFFEEQGLDEAVEPLDWADLGYLIHTVPGVFAIELANRLAGLPGVKAVEPNFWQLRVSR
ncbi:MAG: hypothetical protein F4X59_17080 [Holophagales bacterium]|nr:hypothetical protein [Holophagales bacterium]MYC11820.1 hypothetical protein [Holophagales bacterium]